MAAITIGLGAIDRNNSTSVLHTLLDLTTAANRTGTLSSFEIWAVGSMTGVKMGTFYNTDTNKYTSRDYENIGNVTHGSKQTFTGKNCDVKAGDFLAVRATNTGNIEMAWGSVGDAASCFDDAFGAGEKTFTNQGMLLSIYATGTGWAIAKLSGVVAAAILKTQKIAVAVIKKVMGVGVH